jgi:hypothetical protein
MAFLASLIDHENHANNNFKRISYLEKMHMVRSLEWFLSVVGYRFLVSFCSPKKKLYGEFLDAVTDKIERELILVGAIDAETNCRRGFLSALTS